MSDSRNLNPASLERLHRLGGDSFVCKMLELFLDYAGKKIIEARAAQAAGNFDGVEKAVHPIKSSAGNVGACRIQELAILIETFAREGKIELMADSLDELERAFAAAKPELEERKRSFSSKEP